IPQDALGHDRVVARAPVGLVAVHVHGALLMQIVGRGVRKAAGARERRKNMGVTIDNAEIHGIKSPQALGSKTSRRPSPSMLKPSTSNEMAMPAAITRCGA